MLPAMLALAVATPMNIEATYPPPAGFERVEADAFGTWLRQRTLEPADRPIQTHDGRTVPHAGRVVSLPLVPGDLQQCADTIMRLRGEYLWWRKQASRVRFRYAGGRYFGWSQWSQGIRPRKQGRRTVYLPRAGADRLESIVGQPPQFAKLGDGCSFAPRCPLRFDRCAMA